MNYSYILVGAGLGGITYYGYRNPEFFIPYIVNAIRYYHIVTDYLSESYYKPKDMIIKKR